VWHSGDSIVLRYRSPDGRFLVGRPLTVIEHTPDRVVAYLALGTEVALAVLEDGRDLRDLPVGERWDHPRVGARRTWSTSNLVMIFPRGRAHSLWVFQGPSATGWYVNLEEPYVLGERTITSRDHVLDLWVPAETGVAGWKDEDELEGAVAAGRLTPEEAAGARAEGERVLRERPWPTGWEAFEPDPAWPVPELFPGWDVP
jgi:Protein of unknown function (DUF402)